MLDTLAVLPVVNHARRSNAGYNPASASRAARLRGRSISAELRSSIPDDVFPPYKPPFTVRRVLVAPRGELWIPRVGRWNDTSSTIDVVDRGGHLVRKIRPSADRRIVGFGRTSVYVAARDDVGLEWLDASRCADRAFLHVAP